MFLILSVFTGFLVALMIQLNGILQETTGGISALLFIHISGLAASVLLTLFLGKGFNKGTKNTVPWYYLSAGMVGTAIVFLASLSFAKGGILVSLSGSLAGQTLAASLGEGFYRGNRKRSPMVQRVLAPALLLPGAILIGIKTGVPMKWILVSWTPGILLMIQQTMNSQNTLRWGTPRTVIFNYISALILIIPLFVLSGQFTIGYQNIIAHIPELPWYITAGGGIIGVFTTGSIAFLLLKAPALLVILGIYTGELLGGILLDLMNGNPVVIEKMAGVLLIAAGLASGKIKIRYKPGTTPSD